MCGEVRGLWSADGKCLEDRPLKQGETIVFAGQQEYHNNINPASRFFRERSGAEFAPGSFRSFPAKRMSIRLSGKAWRGGKAWAKENFLCREITEETKGEYQTHLAKPSVEYYSSSIL